MPLRTDVYRFLRFMPMGMLAGMVDAATVGWVLYFGGRESALVAALAGAVVGYPLSFVGHRYVSFRAWHHSLARQLKLFALYKIPNLLIRILIALAVLAHYDWGVVGIILLVVWSFLMERWLFTKESPLTLVRQKPAP